MPFFPDRRPKTAGLESGALLRLDGLKVPIALQPNPRAKRMILRLDTQKSRFRLTLPKRTSERRVLSFLHDNKGWMQRQAQSLTEQTVLQPGASILVAGTPREIVHQDGTGVKVTLHETMLVVTGPLSRLPRAVERYLKDQAREVITLLARTKAEKISQKINRISLKDTVSRWGSCSSNKNLNFSWRLIMAPPDVLDYVVAHEVAHLVHMDHSRAFWSLCRDLSANATFAKQWLKLHGHRLRFSMGS